MTKLAFSSPVSPVRVVAQQASSPRSPPLALVLSRPNYHAWVFGYGFAIGALAVSMEAEALAIAESRSGQALAPFHAASFRNSHQ